MLLGLGLVTSFILLLFFSKEEKPKETTSENEIVSLRSQHVEHLNNSPFKETIKLTKKERKAQGLPPNRYFEQMWELTMNPATGKTEPENIYALQAKLQSSISKNAPGDDASNPWIERGPNDVGGRTRAILFDPNDATNRRVFAGGVSGGLWVNNDITSSSSQWNRVQNVPGNLSVTSITVDPRNSNTLYIGTGEQYTAGAVVGNGVYRSTNGGTTWQAVNIPAAGAATLSFNANNLFLSGLFYVNDVVAWNNTSQNRTELFVGVGAHVYGDASSPSNWLGLQTAGLYRSVDGGSTWNRIESSNLAFDFQGTNYYMIPNDFEVGADNTLWMGTITTPGIGGGGGGRVFSSTNGGTWTEAAASPLTDSNRVELEVSSTNPDKIYALTQGVTDPVHIYRTTDKFATVTATALPNDVDTGIPANDFTRGQAFYDLMIEADPNNDNILYVGGIDLFRSTNGGTSWSQISKWSNNNNLAGLSASTVHADQHAMTFRPGNSNQAIFGNDGGIYFASSLSTAQNSNVFAARNSNYNVTQYVKAGIGPNGAGDASGIFSAGAQDNGSQAFRNTVAGINGSEELTGGDGFYTFVDKGGQYMIATYTNNVIYRFSLPWNGLSRIRGGATTLLNERTTGDFVNQMGYDSDANFLLSNATSGTNYAIKTVNVASNSNANITNALLTSKPTAFIASPFANNTWYVGTATGQLLRLTGVGVGSANWSEITTPFVGSVSSVRLGATANDIMITMHNYGVTSVWFSSNGGTTWLNKEGNLPDIPVRDILQNPLDTKEVILATQLGVWITKDFDATNPNWTQAYNGMSDASVTSFDYWAVNGDDNNNKIIASTYGRGVFTGSFTSNAVADTQAPTSPTGLAASNVAETSLTLTWTASTDNVGVTGYDLYQGNTNLGNVNGTSANVNSLTANTAYQFRVKAKDAAGNESGFSSTVNVTTLSGSTGTAGCTNGITAFPYNEGFESGLGGWTQGSGDDFDWIRLSGGTPSSNTGPSGADSGSFYVYVETSNPNNPSKTTILNSPCFDLSSATSAGLTFKYQMTGNAVGVLKLEASNDNGSSWTQIWSKSGDQGSAWNTADIDLASYTGNSMQLRFTGTSGSSWQGDMAVDTISLTAGGGTNNTDTQAPSVPTNLSASNVAETSITLSWTASSDNVGVTGYDIYQGNANLGSVSGTSANITSLDANTAYQFRVKAKDAAGNESGFSSTFTVTTSGAVPTDPCTGVPPYNGTGQGYQAGDRVTFQGNLYERTATSWVNLGPCGVTTSVNTFDISLEEGPAIPFSLFPNPVTDGNVNVITSTVGSKEYEIYNMLGQKIDQGAFMNIINVSGLQNGLYTLVVDGQVRRFVKK